MSSAQLRRNLVLYPWYQAGISFYAWMPVFFLYFQQKLSLGEVFLLESIYYASVFVFEIPSGFFSDRVGRRPTLIIASLALVASYIVFALGDTFTLLALGQVLLAVGLAFNSGTDTVFHFDTLHACGMADEYGDREAKIARLVLLMGSASALVGGGLGMLDLRFAYVASAVFAGVALVAALMFREATSVHAHQSVVALLGQCWSVTRTSRWVAWLALVWIGAVVVNHLPYEFYQPYFGTVSQQGLWPADLTAGLTGAHAAAVQAIAAVVAGYSVVMVRKVGLKGVLLGSLVLQCLVTASMFVVSPIVAFALALRAVPGAMQRAPMRQALAPIIPGQIRATYLSVLSLLGRVGFSLVLIGMSGAVGAEALPSAVRFGVVVALSVLTLAAVASFWARSPD